MTTERTPQDVLRESRFRDLVLRIQRRISVLELGRSKLAKEQARELYAWITSETGFLDKAIAEVPDSPPEPVYLACGCLEGAHENSIEAVRENHPDIVIPEGFGSHPFYGAAPDTLSEKPGLDVASWNAALAAAKRAVEPLTLHDTRRGYTISRQAVIDRIIGLRKPESGSTDSEGR